MSQYSFGFLLHWKVCFLGRQCVSAPCVPAEQRAVPGIQEVPAVLPVPGVLWNGAWLPHTVGTAAPCGEGAELGT